MFSVSVILRHPAPLGSCFRPLPAGSPPPAPGPRRKGLDAERFAQRLSRRSAPEPVALVTPLEIVVREEAIEVTLDLFGREIPGLPPFDAEALVEQHPVHPLDEAVGLRRSDAGRPMLDAFEGQEQLVGVALGLAAELACCR